LGKVQEFAGTPAFLRSETELADFRAKRKIKAITQICTRYATSQRKGS